VFGHRLHVEDGQALVEPAHFIARRRYQGLRVAARARAHDEARIRGVFLREREVDERARGLRDAEVLAVADDADDLAPGAFGAAAHAPAQRPGHGVGAGEESTGERLVDDDDGRRILGVALAEVAPAG
jgi:hypothetical protein